MSPDVMLTTIKIAIVFVAVSFIVFWVGLVWWVAQDVLTRTTDKIIISVAVAITAILGPVGVVIYLVVRPRQSLKERMGEMMEQEMMLQASAITICPTCQRVAQDNFLACPHCGTILKKACTNCGKLLDKEWDHCAYCGAGQMAGLAEPVATVIEETVELVTAAGQTIASVTTDTVTNASGAVQSITVTESKTGPVRKSSAAVFGAIKWLFTPPPTNKKPQAADELLAELEDDQQAKTASKPAEKPATSKKATTKSHPSKAKKAPSRGKK